ncbi:MAG: exodeoxyribonuclease VII small subunit [Candidatus Merdivicinus sp.]|jgi:exodeoxyribonuclease VII small subunit
MSAAMTLEKALEKLSGLVSQLEEGNLPLEKSLKLYEEGISLSAFCEKELAGARLKITELQGRSAVPAEQEEDQPDE